MSITNSRHLDWVDGAKGVAIVSVFFLHSIPATGLMHIGWMLHIGQAVPIFLFLSAYCSTLKYQSKEGYYSISRFCNMLKKVLLPFLIVLSAQVLMRYVLYGYVISLKSIIKSGGIGPGSYYVWLYIQVWLIMPFIIELVRKTSLWLSLLIMLSISIISEYAFVLLANVEHIDSLYRFIPVRYLMVLYAGCVLPSLSKKSGYVFAVLALLSGFLMIVDVYVSGNQFVITPPPMGWISLVYCFLCFLACFYSPKNFIFRDVENGRKV